YSDADAISTLIADWDIVSMLARAPWPYGASDARHYVSQAVDWPWEFAVLTKGDMPRLIGVASVTGHLGYWLGRPFWGHGYMTEAAGALIDTYFANTDGPKIISGVFVDNPASQKVLLKLGFRETGRSQQMCRARGEEVEHINMSLFRADWTAVRST
ncbi:MAG: GNAT family protein, partial [Pseudomonadota bacterium]